jgi:hypothetical protein
MQAAPFSAPPESDVAGQLRFGAVLAAAVRVGFFALLIGFVLYLTGFTTPLVPIERLPDYWGLPVDQFVRATGTPTGWKWIVELRHGDMANLPGIALLASASAIGLVALLPGLIRRRETALAILTVLQLAVLAFSASNLLAAH